MNVTEIVERLSRVDRDRSHPNRRPVDAATLILVERSGRHPKLLFGRRNERLAFLPGKLVFPGGRTEPDDRRVPVFGTLEPDSERRLGARMVRPSLSRSRALALAAIRETCEETGFLLGTREAGAPPPLPDTWSAFAAAGVFPSLETLRFVARAITPPGRPRRFDTRFFMAERSHVAGQIEGLVGPDAELVELCWLTISEARGAELPAITLAILEEIEHRLAAGPDARLPVPFYYMRGNRFCRETLD